MLWRLGGGTSWPEEPRLAQEGRPSAAAGALGVVAEAPLLPTGKEEHTRGCFSDEEEALELELLPEGLCLFRVTLDLGITSAQPPLGNGEGEDGRLAAKGAKMLPSGAAKRQVDREFHPFWRAGGLKRGWPKAKKSLTPEKD